MAIGPEFVNVTIHQYFLHTVSTVCTQTYIRIIEVELVVSLSHQNVSVQNSQWTHWHWQSLSAIQE